MMQSGEVTLTLSLTQQGNSIQGILSGNTGASFQLSGQVENNIGYGTCSGNEGSVYFEVYADGTDLTLSLIEPDASGAPDYNQAQYLQFTKQGTVSGGGATGAVTGALGLSGQQQAVQQQQIYPQLGNPQQGIQQQPYQQQAIQQQGYPQQGVSGNQYAGSQMAGSQTIAENEVGDPSWGLKFGLPQGWIKQSSVQGAILGHNTIPGMVLVIPHMARNMQEMQAEMLKGIQEEGSYLTPAGGGLQQASQNVLTGDYTGIADGTQVKAKGYGILSPNGGGAYLIALSTPDKLGQELLGAAGSMVQSVQYFKVDNTGLIQHFAGNWANHTSNTSTWISFGPDGTYSEQYEAAYSGTFNDGTGETGHWNTAGQDSDRGRWTVRGNKDSGTIIVKLANGKEIYYEYKVHIENGQKYYREYYFNGYLYAKSD
jgi:hypothetical protein